MLHGAICYMLHGATCYMLYGATWCYMLHGALNYYVHMVFDKFAKYFAFRVESLCNVEEWDGIFGCLGGWGEGCITALYVSLPAGCKPGDSRM